MTPPTQKTHYDTSLKSCVQSAHEYMLAKGIPHNLRDVFEYCSVKEHARYNMIQQGVLSRSYHNSEFEAQGQKYKMTSEQVPKADHILEDDNLGLEAKTLPLQVLAAEVRAEVTRQTIRKKMNVAHGYVKRLACMKGHKSEYSKAKGIE